ncbi:hypothetical protein [Peribacillus simplex]|uniref:hypothetical protein n=1 Tax=Peribacillus simplex TaxID=1478 RepID=UPI003D2BB432
MKTWLSFMVYFFMYGIIIGLKIGGQSAERERISEINWNVFSEKNSRETGFSSNLTTV